MSEPDNCSVKKQLGSTNSKGLPVLFQGLSPRNATKLLLHLHLCQGLPNCVISASRTSKDSNKKGGDPFSILPPVRVRPTSRLWGGREHPLIDLERHPPTIFNPNSSLSALAGATTKAHSVSIATAKGCHGLVIQQTNSLSSQCLGHHKIGEAARMDLPKKQIHRHSVIRGLRWERGRGGGLQGREGKGGSQGGQSFKLIVTRYLV